MVLMRTTKSITMTFIKNPTIHNAAFYGDLRELKIAIDKGQKIDDIDATGMTIFHKAAANGHIHFLEVLLEKGHSVNKQDSNGCTAIHHAAKNGHLETLRWLVDDKGADVTIASKKGRTPHTVTKQNGAATYVRQQEILTFLKSKENGDNPWDKVKTVKTVTRALSQREIKP